MVTKKDLIELEHKFKMQEIKAEKESRLEVEDKRFDYSCQLQRIKNADIKRARERRLNEGFLNSFPNK